MYNNDIKVTIEEAFEPSVGLINRALLVTHEATIPFTKLSGANAVTELETYLETYLTAPLLVQAVTVLVSQTDSSGNPIFPDYIYILGEVVEDYASATDVSAITDLITANTTVESDFWGIIPVKYNLKLVEWLVTFCASKQKAFFVDIESKTFTITDLQKSARGYMIYNGRSGDQASQQFAAGVYGRCFSGESLVGVKFKTVTGITSYKQATLSDSEVSTLATNGVNTYLYRYGKGSIDGSFTTDSDGNLKEPSYNIISIVPFASPSPTVVVSSVISCTVS